MYFYKCNSDITTLYFKIKYNINNQKKKLIHNNYYFFRNKYTSVNNLVLNITYLNIRSLITVELFFDTHEL